MQDRHQSPGILIGQRPQQHGIHYAEDRRCRADAQRQDDHRDHREHGRPQQGSHAVPHILNQRFKKTHTDCVAAFLLGHFHPAKFQPRLPERFSLRQTVSHQIRCVRLDMEAHLLIHLTFHAGAPQQSRCPGARSGPPTHCSLRRRLQNSGNDRGHLVPAFGFRLQPAFPGRCEAVKARAPLVLRLSPLACNQAVMFQPVECGI